MTRTGKAAGDWFHAQVGRDAYHNMCKAFVRTGFDVEPSRSLTAIECFTEAQFKHLTHDPESVPAYVSVFLDTGNPAEHAVATVERDREGHRLCVSTDAGPGSTIGLVRLADLVRGWGPLLGWTEDLDGQRIWTPPPPPPPQTPRADEIYRNARAIVGHAKNPDKVADFERVERIAKRWSTKY